MHTFSLTLKNTTFHLISHFLTFLNERNFQQLEREFQLTKNAYDEILEELEYEGILLKKLSLPPKDIAFTALNDNRAIFELYEINTPEKIGIDCCLYANNHETVLTLSGTLEPKENCLVFHFSGIHA